MFRFQLLGKNPNVLKQIRCWALERHSVGNIFIRTIANETTQLTSDSTPTSKTDISALRQLVKEQVCFDLERNVNERGSLI